MPRRPRNAPGGFVYHVLNRAVARHALFQKEGDYQAFERVFAEALAKHPMLGSWSLPLPGDWTELVNEAQTEAELAGVRQSVKRGSPYGTPQWQQQTARTLGLEATLRPLGRPNKKKQAATQEQQE